MQANHKIGYKTTIADIIRMVSEDFDIFLANNWGELTWTDEKLETSGHINFERTKKGSNQ